jgi:hypothetical protein
MVFIIENVKALFMNAKTKKQQLETRNDDLEEKGKRNTHIRSLFKI